MARSMSLTDARSQWRTTRLLASRWNKRPRTRTLVHRARGWPAVLGMAETGDFRIPPDDLPDQLYDYFAEELYHQCESLAS